MYYKKFHGFGVNIHNNFLKKKQNNKQTGKLCRNRLLGIQNKMNKLVRVPKFQQVTRR